MKGKLVFVECLLSEINYVVATEENIPKLAA